jgi:hypothetical protein
MGVMAPGAGSALPPAAVNGYSIGNYAYDFSAFDQNGNAVTLSQYAGTYTILDFCAVWCPDCRAATSLLAQFSTALNSTGLPETTIDFLLQNAQGLPSTVINSQLWAREFKLSFPVFSVGGDSNAYATAMDQLGNYALAIGQQAGFPTLVVLSPSLKILAVTQGFDGDLTPSLIMQAIQADLTSDPTSGLAEATALTQRRIDAAAPFPLDHVVGSVILDALGETERDLSRGHKPLACVTTATLKIAVTVLTCSVSSTHCPSGAKVLDPGFGAQLGTLVGDVRSALQCPGGS